MLQHPATTSVCEEPSKDKTDNQRRAPYPFTQLPNALYAFLAQIDGSETKVLWVILRRTFGFQAFDQPAAIGLSMFQRETGLARETVAHALSSLARRRLIERSGEGTQRRRYRVIMPGPALVGKSDQAVVQESDQTLVGNFDHLKETSSKKTSPKKKSSVRSDFHRIRTATTNTSESPDFLADDEVAARASKAPEGLSPEEELKAIVLEKSGVAMHWSDLRGIKETLELRRVSLESFVREVRLHRNGRWENPIGFLIWLSKRNRFQVQPAESAPANKPQKCGGCSGGFLRHNPDVFCSSCELGRDLASQARRDEERKIAICVG